MKIILASASPRRRELMKLITPDFEAISTDVDEKLPEHLEPTKASEYLSVKKAVAAMEQYPDCLVIGCDTTVLCGGKILGKPADHDECVEYIRMLSGRTHQVITSCTIICTGEPMNTFTSVTDVTFRSLSDEEIEAYASTDEPYDKAGGYGIQGRGALLIKGIKGDYFTVVGLPVSELYQKLKKYFKEL